MGDSDELGSLARNLSLRLAQRMAKMTSMGQTIRDRFAALIASPRIVLVAVGVAMLLNLPSNSNRLVLGRPRAPRPVSRRRPPERFV